MYYHNITIIMYKFHQKKIFASLPSAHISENFITLIIIIHPVHRGYGELDCTGKKLFQLFCVMTNYKHQNMKQCHT